MDLPEQRQLEVARQMAEAKAQARPWHAIFAHVLTRAPTASKQDRPPPGGDAPQA